MNKKIKINQNSYLRSNYLIELLKDLRMYVINGGCIHPSTMYFNKIVGKISILIFNLII